jgi:hypothetical protein
MRCARWILPASLVAMAWLAIAAAAEADQAAQLRPIDLRVFGGQESWHADNDFRLDWDRPPVADDGFAVTAVDYRVRDADGTAVVPETHLPWETTQIDNIHLPRSAPAASPAPGVYTADVWLEGPGGARGPRTSATLRFDDARPGSAQPQAGSAWVAGNTSALVRLEHPAGPVPLSGIRGYAISVDRGAGGAPCAGRDRCSPAETDLRSGVDGDTISLGILAEGVNVVRAVAVSGSGMRSAETRSAIVRVDATKPEVTPQGIPPGWSDGPVRVSALARDSMSGMAVGGPSGAFTAIAIDGGVPRVAEGESVTASVSGEGTHAVAFYARDAAGNSGESSATVAAVRIDASPPRVAFANRQDPSEPERVEAVVSDPLSGPDPARGSIAVRPAGSRQPFETLPTTATAARLVARWDSDAFAPGSYEFRAGGYDTAGNLTVTDRRANGTRMVLANPLKAPTEIEAGFGSRRAVSRRCGHGEGHGHCRHGASESFESHAGARAVPYGQAIPFAGRLSLASGARIGGLPVQIVETFGAGSDLSRRTSVVQTAPDGTFVARLAPGPSREVEAVFAGSRVLGRCNGQVERLEVLGGIRLHASATMARVGGAPVVFSGRVGDLGAPIPVGGRPVELQFRLAGGAWSEFRTVRTDVRGRFRYPYAFSDDDSRGARFQFRAFVPGEEDWPYEPVGSRPVFVTGR